MIDGFFKAAFITLALVSAAAYAGEVDPELERKLDEAHERLEEASREVAELSAQLGESVANEVVHQFRLDGRRAMIGINMDDPNGNADGVLIEGVTPGGPAEQAGLRAGDVIVSMNGKALTKDDEGSPQRKVMDIMRDVDPGDEVSIEYERDGKKSAVTVVTDEMDPEAFSFAFGKGMDHLMSSLDALPAIMSLPNLHDFNSRWGDMEMVTLTSGLGEYFGTDKGILIVRAPKNKEIPLEDGDVILRIDGRTPTSPGHALRILHSYQGGEHLSIDIVRKQNPMTVEVDLPERKNLRESALPRTFNVPVPASRVTT
jgi:S1-C subfamily serine protease